MGLSGQSLRSQTGSGLWPWEGRHWPGLFSRRSAGEFMDGLLCGAVRQLDGSLRRRQGIIEFTDDVECILRLSAHQAERDVALGDGMVRRGDRIGELHLWNEHILPMSGGGANMVWGAAMRRRLRRSLVRLAAFVDSDLNFAGIQVFRGEAAFGPGKELDRTRCFAAGFGFEITKRPKARGLGDGLAAAAQTLFMWGMVRTFNRGAWRTLERLARPTWFQLWMTRGTLRRRYGAENCAPAVEATGK
jgi:hypothetical protein